MIQTDQEAYTATLLSEQETSRGYVLRRFGFEMVVTFENTTDDTIYVSSCSNHIYSNSGPVLVSSLSDDDETSYFISCFNAGDYRTFALEPGVVRTDTLFNVSPRGWDGPTGEPLGVAEGTFQLIMHRTGTCLNDENSIASECEFSRDEMPRSNTFEIKLEEGAIR